MTGKTEETLSCQTSDEAASRLAETEAALEVTKAQLETLQADRESALIVGGKKLDDHDKATTLARREIERLLSVKKHLEARLVELTDFKNKQAAASVLKSALKAQKRGVEIYGEFSQHATRIGNLLEELRQIHDEINAAHDVAAQAGLDCGSLQLPHWALSEPDQHTPAEYQDGPTVKKPVYKFEGGVGEIVGYEDITTRVVRTEASLIIGRKAIDLTGAKIVLPDPMDCKKMIVRANSWKA